MSAELQAAVDEAAADGARMVVAWMTDREARRPLPADWVRRHAQRFPGGNLHFDMHDVRRDGPRGWQDGRTAPT